MPITTARLLIHSRNQIVGFVDVTPGDFHMMVLYLYFVITCTYDVYALISCVLCLTH